MSAVTSSATTDARLARLREASERIYDPAAIQDKLSGLTGAQQDLLWKLYRSSRSELTTAELQQQEELIAQFQAAASDIEADVYKVFGDLRMDNWDLNSVRRIGRDKQLLDQINNRIRALGGEVKGTLNDGLLDQFKQSWVDGAYRLDALTPDSISINTALMPDREIMALLDTPFNGASFSDRLGIITDDMAHQIKQALLRSMIEGESWQEAARRIRDQMGTEGQKSVWRAEMISRTELARAQELANAQLYAQNDDVIEKVIFIAHPGACDECRERHGEVLTDPSEYPPWSTHPNCVCDALAVPKSWDGLATPEDGDFSVTPQSRSSWVVDQGLADAVE